MGCFLFIPLFLISAILSVATQLFKAAEGKARIAVVLVTMTVLAYVVPESFSYVAYMVDAPRYQGRLASCKSDRSRTQALVDEYAKNEGKLPEQLSSLVPSYTEEVPKCPGHVLFAKDSGEEAERVYLLEEGVVVCPSPGEKPTFAAWKAERSQNI